MKLRTLASLSSLKDSFSSLKKSGIYKAVCEDCSATYYGQTGRTFRTRIMMEHLNEYKTARRSTQGVGTSAQTAHTESAIARHSLITNHPIEHFSFKLIHLAIKGRCLHRLEEAYTLKAVANKEKIPNDLGSFTNPFITYYFQHK